MIDTTTALRALAADIRERAPFGFVQTLQVTLAERQASVGEVVGIANEVDALADESVVRDVGRAEVSSLMDRLRSLGKRPPTRLVIAVETTIGAAERSSVSR